jgi:hypothetical protein
MVLRNDKQASVNIPNSEKIEEYKAMVRSWHPFLTDVWCTMDGLKLTLEQSGDALIQEWFYNGWTHDHYVSSVLCCSPDRTIPIAYVKTVRLLAMGVYMTNLNWCMTGMVHSAQLTLLLVR